MTKMILIMYDDTPCLTVGNSIKNAALAIAKFYNRIQNPQWVSKFYSQLMENMEERDFEYFQKEFQAWKNQDTVWNIGELEVRQADCNKVSELQNSFEEHKVMYDVFEDWNIPTNNHYSNKGTMISETCMLVFLDSSLNFLEEKINSVTKSHY